MLSNTAVEGNSQSKAKRVCSECNAATTYSNWYRDGKGGWLCRKCWDRYYHQKRIRFGSIRRIYLHQNPRKGVCVRCGGTTKNTDMHHTLGYFIIFPWFGTKELCDSCHAVLTFAVNNYHIIRKGNAH